jgi:hypothetical protein
VFGRDDLALVQIGDGAGHFQVVGSAPSQPPPLGGGVERMINDSRYLIYYFRGLNGVI